MYFKKKFNKKMGKTMKNKKQAIKLGETKVTGKILFYFKGDKSQ